MYLLRKTDSGRPYIRSIVENRNDKLPTRNRSLLTQAIGNKSHGVNTAAGKVEPTGNRRGKRDRRGEESVGSSGPLGRWRPEGVSGPEEE